VRRTHIMLHHSLTADGPTVSWGAIEAFHTSWRKVEADGMRTSVTEDEAMKLKAAGAKVEAPWSDIGYHAGVELVGDRYYAMLGRSIHRQAAACPESGMNVLALHVCCVGNYDVVKPSAAMLFVLKMRVLLPWMNQFGIAADKIVCHRDFNPSKSCPGTLFDPEDVRRLVQ